jgi:hypothetical protein
MLRILAAAAVAASLIGGPVLAQGTAPATNTNQPAAVKTDVPKTSVKSVKKHSNVRVAKRYKYRKHYSHRHIKHVKQVKHVKQPAKIRSAS